MNARSITFPGLEGAYDIPQTAEDVGARPNTWMPTAEEVGARPNTWTPTAQDVGARPDNWMPTPGEIGAATLLQVYPVGSIYMSVNSTSPSTLFGGTWVQLKDRFLLGAGDTYTNGKTGGAAEVTLTVNQMPSHRHSTAQEYVSENGNSFDDYTVQSDHLSPTEAESKYYPNYTDYTGGGKAHNNMPPYLTVYMWKRTA